VFRLVLAESVVLGAAGGILGVGTATLFLMLSPMSIGAEAVTVAFTPSLRLAAAGVGISLAAGVLAGIAPGWQAARTEIVPALRQG
jgi:putative ABC transport system permease protein